MRKRNLAIIIGCVSLLVATVCCCLSIFASPRIIEIFADASIKSENRATEYRPEDGDYVVVYGDDDNLFFTKEEGEYKAVQAESIVLSSGKKNYLETKINLKQDTYGRLQGYLVYSFDTDIKNLLEGCIVIYKDNKIIDVDFVDIRRVHEPEQPAKCEGFVFAEELK